MISFNWNESYSVNVEEIDAQHKMLFEILNSLALAMQVNRGREAIGYTLDSLFDYSVYHFSTEEKYFEELNYPDSFKHKQEHDRFVESLIRFRDDFKTGKNLVSVELLNFLRNWIKDHIQGSDKKFGPYFNENGLT